AAGHAHVRLPRHQGRFTDPPRPRARLKADRPSPSQTELGRSSRNRFAGSYLTIVTGVPQKILWASQVISLFGRRTQPWDTAVPGLACRPSAIPWMATWPGPPS